MDGHEERVMTLNDLLDSAKERLQLKSDRGLCRHFGWPETHASQFRIGSRHPTEKNVITLCDAAGIPHKTGLAWLNVWRASSPAAAAAYRELAGEDLADAGTAHPH